MAFSPLPPLLFFFLLVSSCLCSTPLPSLSPSLLCRSHQCSYVVCKDHHTKGSIVCLVSIGRCGNGRNCFLCSSLECNFCWPVVRGKRRCLLASSGGRRFVRSACRAVKVRACAEEDVPSERSTLIVTPLLLTERPRIRVCSLRVCTPLSMCIFDVSPLWTSSSPSVRWSSSHWDYEAACPWDHNCN
jgi:hypothetical protein